MFRFVLVVVSAFAIVLAVTAGVVAADYPTRTVTLGGALPARRWRRRDGACRGAKAV